jgi:hypothetical protein
MTHPNEYLVSSWGLKNLVGVTARGRAGTRRVEVDMIGSGARVRL